MTGVRQYTALAESIELNLLAQLHGMLEFDRITERAEFSDLMNAAFGHCKLDPRQLSDDLGYNFSTVYRWIEGRTAPHPSLWPTITQWIAEAIKAKIDEAQANEAVGA
mgnify:CR=1 FL=1